MSAAAVNFLSSLTEEQRAATFFPFDDPERQNWHFIPKQRRGLPLGAMNDHQRTLQRRLLETGLSSGGMEKLNAIVKLEARLAEVENDPVRRDPSKYYTTLFGDPASGKPWAWRFEGHHVSLNFTLGMEGHISVTPSFLAANPAHVTEGKLAGTRPLALEEDLARSLARSLHASGKPVVFRERPPTDVLMAGHGPLRLPAPVGVSDGEFSAAQGDQFQKLITEFTARHRPELMERQLAEIRRQQGKLHFAWAGSLEPGEPFYYRIQGVDFLVEVANTQNHGNHIHTLWRDRAGDFRHHPRDNQ